MKHYTITQRARFVFQTAFLCGFLSVMVAPVALGQTTTPTPVPLGPAPAPPVMPTPTPRPANPLESLRTAKMIYVRSHSVLVGQSVIESKLRKRPEFQQLGLAITRDPAAADLILELEHDILTKYVFTAIDPWTNVVVASGKLSSLGGTVAGKVAKRFMKQVMKARTGP